jgi:hypothetical protein
MPRKKSSGSSFSLARIFPIGFGGIFVVAGALFLYFLGIQTSLECRRSEAINCTLHTTWMNLFEINQSKVDGLRRSWVDSRCDEQGCTYWVMLTTVKGEEIRFSDGASSDRSPKRDISNQINSAIEDQRQTFSVGSQDGWWIVLPLVFILVGLGIAIGLPLIFSPKHMTVKE